VNQIEASKLRAQASLSLEEARRLLKYDPETGVLTWRLGGSGAGGPGSVAGSIPNGSRPDKYSQVMVRGLKFYAHRLAWFIYHGVWPSDMLDHINRNKSDNRIENLREATNAQNQYNSGLPVTNTTGVPGVCWHHGKYQVSIRVNGTKVYVGRYTTLEGAAKARKDAELRYRSGWA
jgi:hypothetical protein